MSDSHARTFQVDFMGKRLIAMVLSAVVLAAALGSLALQGLNLGLDFTGGSLVEVKLAEKVDPQTVRGYLVNAGFTNGTVQTFGSILFISEVLLRICAIPFRKQQTCA